MSNLLSSSVGRKIFMALTGLFLITFLLVHLVVNLTLFAGEEVFNGAVHFMDTNPIIQVMQPVLAIGFIAHIVMGIKLELKNRSSRPVKYYKENSNANSSWISRNMIITGVMIFVFLILHLKDYFVPMKTTDVENDYLLVTTLFKNPLYVLIYVIGFIALGLHLVHGFQSSFTSTGVRYPKIAKCIDKVGTVFSFAIALGFSVIAIYFYFA